MNSKIKSILLGTLCLYTILLFIPQSQYANNYPQEYQTQVMKAVNDKRSQVGLKKVQIDPALCELAEKLALDSEIAYPNKINGTLKSNPRYSKYLTEYNIYKTNSLSKLDMLVEFLKVQDTGTEFSIEDLTKWSTDFDDQSGIEFVAADSEITHACIGDSAGEQGYKAFVYFVGGVKTQPGNIFASFWNSIKSLWDF